MMFRAGGVVPRLSAAASLVLAVVLASAARAATPDFAPNTPPDPAQRPGLLCREAVRRADAGGVLPRHLLAGIARVESGRRDPATGRIDPWPWMINSQGQDHIFASKAEAVAFARQLQARGLPSFDAGCLQVNLMYHPDAFASLEEAFDPLANATYAVKFLTELHAKTGSWETAAAWYHSANPAEGLPYQGKVITAMAAEAAQGDAAPALQANAVPGMQNNAVPAMQNNAVPGMQNNAVPAMPTASRPSLVPLPLARVAGMAMPTGFSPPVFPPPASAPAALSTRGPPQSGLVASGLAVPNLVAPAALAGRDLNAYRMHPVAVVGARLLAAR